LRYRRFLLFAAFATKLLDAATITSGKITIGPGSSPNYGGGGSITLSDGITITGVNPDGYTIGSCTTTAPNSCSLQLPPFLTVISDEHSSDPFYLPSSLHLALSPFSLVFTPVFGLDNQIVQIPFTASGSFYGPQYTGPPNPGYIYPCQIPGIVSPQPCTENVFGAGFVKVTVYSSQGLGLVFYAVSEADYIFQPIPEPSTVLLFVTSLLIFLLARRAGRNTPFLRGPSCGRFSVDGGQSS
jgi:hypothetical protein